MRREREIDVQLARPAERQHQRSADSPSHQRDPAGIVAEPVQPRHHQGPGQHQHVFDIDGMSPRKSME